MFVELFHNKQDIEREFQVELSQDDNILYAYYSYEDYSGSAYVLYENNGKLYEVHGSHCSCNGLEDQWTPEETSVVALLHRMENGQFSSDVREVLAELAKIDKGEDIALFLVSENAGIRNIAQRKYAN